MFTDKAIASGGGIYNGTDAFAVRISPTILESANSFFISFLLPTLTLIPLS
jgi:hypothetical protein